MADTRTGLLIKTLAGESVTVTATDLDIRNLAPATDTVQIGDGVETLLINADGSLNAVVSATDLDIRALASGTDSVTVVATDLDVRDLTHVSDSVKIGDGVDLLAVNADGSLNVVVQATAATPVFDYGESLGLAQNATADFDYVVTNTKNFTGKLLKVGTLGQCKVTVGTWNGVDTFVARTTFFQGAGLNPDHSLAFYEQLGDGTVGIRVSVTNLDDATNVYCTISSEEI
jgi:hypothetical protein